MTDRARILAALRGAAPAPAALPDSSGPWQRFADPAGGFTAVLESVGGSCVRVAKRSALAAALAELPVWTNAERTYSAFADIPGRGGQLGASPHDAADLDCALLPGRFAVAENAAVWVCEEDVPHRVLYFLPQHVALVVAAGQIVHNLHDAYARLDLGAPGFGCFISGPSKTADIEQALVIGAHGPRSLTVFLVDESP